jgi:hypothetical protein
MTTNLTAARLRDVAEAIETSGVRFAHVCVGGAHVDIDDVAFEAMFAGCVLAGKRRPHADYIEVIGEKYGISWKSQLWRPSNKHSQGTERVAIGNAAQSVPTLAIDGE